MIKFIVTRGFGFEGVSYIPTMGFGSAADVADDSIHRIFRVGPSSAGGDVFRGTSSASGSSLFGTPASGSGKLWR